MSTSGADTAPDEAQPPGGATGWAPGPGGTHEHHNRSGKTLVRSGGGAQWKFDTPRGRMVVLGKEEKPFWIPPDWHFVEAARKRGLGVVHLQRGQSLPLGNGAVLTVVGSDVPSSRQMVSVLRPPRTIPAPVAREI